MILRYQKNEMLVQFYSDMKSSLSSLVRQIYHDDGSNIAHQMNYGQSKQRYSYIKKQIPKLSHITISKHHISCYSRGKKSIRSPVRYKTDDMPSNLSKYTQIIMDLSKSLSDYVNIRNYIKKNKLSKKEIQKEI